MCGVAGIIWREAAGATAHERVARMLARERHRGPDDEGVASVLDPRGDERGALGNVRLAILDPSPSGHQPMVDAATGNVLVLNGELYNHHEVRRALDDGTPWRSGSDTETLLRAYGRWGTACLERFRGMFAFALWDPARQDLWCARDRLGIKPFYFWQGPAGFAFASELRALLESDLVPRRLDPEGLASYVRFGSVSDPRSIIDGVRVLPAGDWIRVAGGKVTEQHTYWRPVVSRHAQADPATTVRANLTRAVGEHLLSDVPVASFLSGGVDSSVITALAARASSAKVSTFTLGFNERSHDESEFAAAIARHCGTEHHAVLLDPETVAERVPLAVAALDQPSIDGVNTWLISKIVADEGFKVVLSGLGGDELFGGYPSFRWVPRAARWSPWLRPVPKRLIARAAGGGGRGGRVAALFAARRSVAARYEQVRALWSDHELLALSGSASRAAPLATWDPGPAHDGAAVSLLELSGYMRSTLLRDSDAMSMSHSLELRVPFLDHELVQACLDGGAADASGRRGGKDMLRSIAAELFPRKLLDRPKAGFALPMDVWMRGPLRTFVDDGARALQATGLVPGADALLGRFRAGQLPWARLWQFVVLGHWLSAHVPGQGS